MMEPGTVITITFEDHGQDFLEWDICSNVVVGCSPFQSRFWVNSRIVEPMERLEIGHRPLILTEVENQEAMRVKYPLECVIQHSTLRTEIPCFYCGEEVPTSLAFEISFESKAAECESFKAYVCPICAENLNSQNEEDE